MLVYGGGGACRHVVRNPRCKTQRVIRYNVVFFTTPLYPLTLLYLSTPLRGATICILQHRCILHRCCILQQCCEADTLWFMLLANIGKMLDLLNCQCYATAAFNRQPQARETPRAPWTPASLQNTTTLRIHNATWIMVRHPHPTPHTHILTHHPTYEEPRVVVDIFALDWNICLRHSMVGNHCSYCVAWNQDSVDLFNLKNKVIISTNQGCVLSFIAFVIVCFVIRCNQRVEYTVVRRNEGNSKLNSIYK